jgi:hypothetical protein
MKQFFTLDKTLQINYIEGESFILNIESLWILVIFPMSSLQDIKSELLIMGFIQGKKLFHYP